ncbi:peptidyl-prolyl cis-trans isomerase CYP21-4 isoform X2 [Aegilops tauschii subsp. strangulata]|uniref:peptidyl-prolyl cis-trans isomerase CYP21-4 isoform X2 n=1 Tax=Aegilops tauschii subsp. strangulata TaxID=200361 RepID=UPI00098A7898|nr:peptidyl-prolyl cis-trans isomerase CYP21-4 isoform X2 [Aegilops tauschii subsp. strangulata]XP_044331910.1 peptidyl-prolyl cis-trans isomerase CYP21-4-like isoform X2 [Triticum aestivum]
MARLKPKQLLIQSKTKKGPSRISYSSIITWKLIVVLVVLSLYATYRHWHHRPAFEAEMDLPRAEIMDTLKGSITIEISKDASAGVVDRFINLCKSDYFKGMPFRHVIKNSVIHGGDFDLNGAAHEWILKAKASGENALSPKHEAFMIGTTRSPNSKGFDLFITTAPIPDLNDKIVLFGRVIKGEDIVQEIEEIDTDEHYQPKTPIGIINISLIQEL